MASRRSETPGDHPSTYNAEYEDGDDSITFSSGRTLASNITRYRYENGRRYHAYRDGEYYQPNDERQLDYENITHHLWLLTFNDELFLAPLQDPQRVLDIGTGAGLWPIDLGDRFPGAEIIGTDLSPTQVTSAPPNVRFEIDDCCSEWTYPENTFDLVHVRGLLGSVSDWPEFYNQCFKHIQPGGYIEHCEFSVQTLITGPSDSSLATSTHREAFNQFEQNMVECGRRGNKTFCIAEQMKDLISEAGFVDVVGKTYYWPIGEWTGEAMEELISKGFIDSEHRPKQEWKDIGRWSQSNWLEGGEGWILALFTRMLGWSYEDVQKFLGKLHNAVRDRECRAATMVRVAYGRKPE